MAEIQIQSSKKKKGVKRLVKKRMNVDLTPMVDLGFLLITFFLLTTLTTPTITNLIMPKDDKADYPVGESSALTLLPEGNNKIYYYEGQLVNAGNLQGTNYGDIGGIRDLLLANQQRVLRMKGSGNELVVIIKPGKDASYKNVMDILDEMKINDIGHYYLSDEDATDKKILATTGGQWQGLQCMIYL